MADPITIGIAVITGLVGAYKAYTEYKAAVVKAQAEQQAAPAKTEEAAKGEQIAQVVKAAVQQHGDDKDRNALVQFEADPDDYRDVLEKKLVRLAEGNPVFAQQLQTLAQHSNIQTGGVHGEVNVSGEGKVDLAAGVNTGTMTYHTRDDTDT
jgi:hypothetical protein